MEANLETKCILEGGNTKINDHVTEAQLWELATSKYNELAQINRWILRKKKGSTFNVQGEPPGGQQDEVVGLKPKALKANNFNCNSQKKGTEITQIAPGHEPYGRKNRKDKEKKELPFLTW